MTDLHSARPRGVAPRQAKAPARVEAVRTDQATAPVAGWPYRWYLVPPAAAAAAWLAAVALYVWASLGEVLLLAAAAAVAVAGVAGTGERRISDRVAIAGIGAAGLAWLVTAAQVGPWHPVIVAWWALLGLALAVPLWLHPWTTHRVRRDLDLRAWPARAERLGIEGARLYGIEWTGNGRKLLIELAEGQTWRQLRAETAESVLDVAPGSVTIERSMASARRVVMHVQDVDPWEDLDHLPHPALQVLDQVTGTLPSPEEDPAVAAWRPGAGTVREPITLGEHPDAAPASLPVWRPTGAVHWLVGGMTGSGKSVLYKVLLAGLARCRDVVIWGIDTGKSGKAFGPWAPVMGRIARTLPEAVELLRDALWLIQTSADAAADDAAHGVGTDNVEPSPERPLVVVVVDEAADLLGVTLDDARSAEAALRAEAVELTEKIAATGRSEAVSLILATQRPDPSSLGGSTKIRSQCTVGICLRVARAEDMRWVLQGQDADDLDPSLFRRAGLLYAQDGPTTVPVPIRTYSLLDPADCRAIATVLAPGMTRLPDWLTRPTSNLPDPSNPAMEGAPAVPALPTTPPSADTGDTGREASARAVQDVTSQLAAMRAEAEAETTSDLPPIPLAELAAVHEPGDVEVEPATRAAVLDALAAAGSDGIRRADLEEATGIDSWTVQQVLAALERAGQATGEPGTGRDLRWYATPTATAQETA